MKFDAKIIHKPQNQRPVQRFAWSLVTLAFWAVFCYLWAPLVTLLLWVFGVRLATLEIQTPMHLVDPFVLMALPTIAGFCVVSLIGWAEYNRYRFAREDRRLPQQDIDREQVAHEMGASPAVAQQLGCGKIVMLHLDEQARPVTAKTRLLGAEWE